MKNFLFITVSALFLILAMGCKPKQVSKAPVDQMEKEWAQSAMHNKELCFESGGSEYHLDVSGKGNNTCVYKK